MSIRNYHNELPIRSKIEIARDIAQIMKSLHGGRRAEVDRLLETLKARALYLDEHIQQAVLMFAEQVQFQCDYDPWHAVTLEVQQAADRLIEEMGFQPPR